MSDQAILISNAVGNVLAMVEFEIQNVEGGGQWAGGFQDGRTDKLGLELEGAAMQLDCNAGGHG